MFRNGLFWQGKIKNVWAYNSKDNYCKVQFSCSIHCQSHNLEKMKRSRILRFWVLMCLIPEKTRISYTSKLLVVPNPQRTHKWKPWHYSVKQWLTLGITVIKIPGFYSSHTSNRIFFELWPLTDSQPFEMEECIVLLLKDLKSLSPFLYLNY